MFTSHPRDALVLAHAHACRLREETAAERLRPATRLRPTLTACLRRAADRIYQAPLAGRPA
jgi:hypothetical protein